MRPLADARKNSKESYPCCKVPQTFKQNQPPLFEDNQEINTSKTFGEFGLFSHQSCWLVVHVQSPSIEGSLMRVLAGTLM